MTVYYSAEAPKKIYKLTQEQDKVWLYWVMVQYLEDGSFQYGRGRDLMKSWEIGIQALTLMASPATQGAYDELVKEYLLTDHKTRTKLLNDEKKQD